MSLNTEYILSEHIHVATLSWVSISGAAVLCLDSTAGPGPQIGIGAGGLHYLVVQRGDSSGFVANVQGITS